MGKRNPSMYGFLFLFSPSCYNRIFFCMPRILIIEDDLTFAQILEAFLKRNGFRTDAVADISSADRMLAAAKYDLLLLDYRLPDGTGMDLLQKVKPAHPALPVIIMTSFHDIRT